MEKVKITAIEDVASGVSDKTGKSWNLIKISIEGKEYQFRGFTNNQTDKWKVGTEVNLELENDSKYGWQFKVPKTTNNLEARLDSLEESVNALLRAVKPDMGVNTKTPTFVIDKIEGEPEPVPTPNEEDESLPF